MHTGQHEVLGLLCEQRQCFILLGQTRTSAGDDFLLRSVVVGFHQVLILGHESRKPFVWV